MEEAKQFFQIEKSRIKFDREVQIDHLDGSVLKFAHSCAIQSEKRNEKTFRVTKSNWIWVFTEHHGIYVYPLEDTHLITEHEKNGHITQAWKNTKEPYLKPIQVWSIQHQKRFVELIIKHASVNTNDITHLELSELHWLGHERERLGYPILPQEKKEKRKIQKWIKNRTEKKMS